MQRPMPDEGPETSPEDDDAEEKQGDETARPTPASARGSRARSGHPGTHRDPF
jgi:hypothetical protein